ncbi:hypothetical protein [Mucilaginibacter paludis]|uniref:Uncharacterized protein n=1 Tax=Mucilaginibacter paludis DSM 18603 TaxID=714943 RepID=H1XZA0_9SPHI|nr:hypothetical protein [Mucilaginibacter paludis]EHQ25588.1 hypothetical protein Mucpa_1430 [Mucilaginibacter paludis DSM 18603]
MKLKTFKSKMTFCMIFTLIFIKYGYGQHNKSNINDADLFFTPNIIAGSTLSDITYRVIALHGDGFADRVTQVPATGTFTFMDSAYPSVIKWHFSARMDGKPPIEDAIGEYRDTAKIQCFNGNCNLMTSASSPFYNPTFWGRPKGKLVAGQTWTVRLDKPWELGPAGQQKVTVVTLDRKNGIIILKREGYGDGPYEGKHDSTAVKKDGKTIMVATKYGKAHWVGQAIFQHGVTISDELLTITPVEINSNSTGTIQAEERQYMSLLQHPDAIHLTKKAPNRGEKS